MAIFEADTDSEPDTDSEDSVSRINFGTISSSGGGAYPFDAPLKKWTSIYRYTSAVRIQLENNIPVLSVTFFCCKNG